MLQRIKRRSGGSQVSWDRSSVDLSQPVRLAEPQESDGFGRYRLEESPPRTDTSSVVSWNTCGSIGMESQSCNAALFKRYEYLADFDIGVRVNGHFEIGVTLNSGAVGKFDGFQIPCNAIYAQSQETVS